MNKKYDLDDFKGFEYELKYEDKLSKFSSVSEKTMKKEIPKRTGISRKNVKSVIQEKKGDNSKELFTFLGQNKRQGVSPLAHLIENGHKKRGGVGVTRSVNFTKKTISKTKDEYFDFMAGVDIEQKEKR